MPESEKVRVRLQALDERLARLRMEKNRLIARVKRERLAGKWRGHGTGASKSIKPGTVNRELDTLRSVFSQALEWGQIREHPMRKVKRLKLDNRRTRILTEPEQAC